MMKKVLIFLAVLTVILLTGCGENDTPKKVNAAIVIGTHANGGGVPVYSEELVDSVRSVCLTYGHISIVSSEGSPAVIGDYDIPEPAKDGLSEAKLQHIAEEYVGQFLSMIANHAATSEEVDTIEAITLAARTLTGIEGEKYLIVCDSGLSTAGYLNFSTSNILHSSPEAVKEELTAKNAIPALDGVNVVWIGLGDVSLPQETLSAKEKDNLRAIWQGILEAAGTSSVTFSSALPVQAKEGLPHVTPVPVEGVHSVSVFPEPVTLDDTQVGFIGDTAQYRDPEQAIEALTPVAEALSMAPEAKILIIGTTATGDETFCQQLSEDRCAAVKATLLELGVDDAQMQTIGLGFHDPWHVEDCNEDGSLIESLAVRNRKVLIMDAYGEGVSEIFEGTMVH